MAEESKSQASRVVSEVAPTEQNSTTFNEQSQSQNPDTGPGQYQGQAGGKKCMCNPCKCCCKGNLRQACAVIAQVEIGLGVIYLILFIYGLVSPGSSSGTTGTGTRQYQETSTPSASGFAIFLLVAEVVYILLMIGAGVVLLLGVIKRMKVACLVHAALAIILSVCNFAGVISCILVLAAIEPYVSGDKCKNPDPDDVLAALLCTGPGKTLGSIVTAFFVIILLVCLLFAILYAYFASNSIALYCHFKNGVTYEGTPFNGCCGGRGQTQVQPQYQNQNYQYGQPPPEGQSQYQSQSQYHAQPQSEEPAPEYSTTEVQSKPKIKKVKSGSKSRVSSNVSASKKSTKKQSAKAVA